MSITAGPRVGAIRILGISGSLREASFNTTLLHAAAELAGPAARLALWRELATVPPFNEDDETEPAAPVHTMRKAIAGAHALLIATPEYNGSIPGQLKNALDWASRPYGASVLTDKPVAVVAASVGDHGAAGAQANLRKVLRGAGARVLDRTLGVGRAHEAFGADGRLQDPHLRAALRQLLHELRHLARPAVAA